MKRRPIAPALVLVLALTAAACSGGGGGERGQADRSDNTTPVSASGTYPLTGLPATDAGKARRQAVAVKIDNNAAARPQAGIEHADVVYEEFTEGITRFVVVFHSADAPTVGPVRSVRPGDANIVKPLGGPLVISGGSTPVLGVINAANVRMITENDTDTLRRRSGRRAPHNLYTGTEAMFRKAGGGSPPPVLAPFLRGGQQYAPAGVTPATKLTVTPAPNVRASYDWDQAAGAWKRSTDGRPHMLEGGAQIAPKNVVVQYTPYSNFPPDRKVRYPEVVGSGDAVILVNGTQVRARWTKSSPTAVTTYADSAGAPIPLAPGQTWVHLQEPGSAATIG
ncbi:MAG TPA: DUF3048 domain-containing protein [Acidimicrobiales bacterium]|nr:DUF3048 domain-containing protein [Acidimicrobiales bacterium]